MAIVLSGSGIDMGGNPVSNVKSAESSNDAVSLSGVSILQTASSDVTAETPTSHGIVTLNYTGATGTITLPTNVPAGGRVLVRKLNATQGNININAPTGETITRAGLSSVQLNDDGDYWLLEKVSLSRWELVDGHESGENANGRWVRTTTKLSMFMVLGFPGLGVGNRSETKTFPTPATTADGYAVSITCISYANSVDIIGGLGDRSTLGCKFYVKTNHSTSGIVSTNIILEDIPF